MLSSQSNLETEILEAVEEAPEISSLHPSCELVQEREDPVDSFPSSSSLSEISDYTDRIECFSLPDAHALLNVTSRRRKHQNKARLSLEGHQSVEKLEEFSELCFEDDAKMKLDDAKIGELKVSCLKMQCTPIKNYSSSPYHLTEGAIQGPNNLTLRESEAILVIKQLQEQIKSLEVEKISVQVNLDNVFALATEQNASFREKYEKLQQDARNARDQTRTTHEQLCLLYNLFFSEINDDTPVKLSLNIAEISSFFDFIRHGYSNAFAIFEECFQFFSILSEILESLTVLPRSCMVQLKSIISGHKSINTFLSNKYQESEIENRQIHELMSDLEKREKIAADQGLHHDMEKDELFSQILALQKEVSQLSSSSLTREKEALRKELDKSKSKLKDTECKLKNITQEKVKLEGEKAQAEREIKSLLGQRAILERDILKRDSLLDRRQESRSEFNKVRGLKHMTQQNLQNDYEKFEFIAFEMEAEISSLKEALEIITGEKEEAYAKNEILNSELEAMANKLCTADFELELLKEELKTMEERLADSECSCRGFQDSLNLVSREKEEMILQLTEALLEVELEKSAWVFKERRLSEKLNISNNEIVKLLDSLSEARKELDLCNDQRNGFSEKLSLSDEYIKRERDNSIITPSEIGKLRDEFSMCKADADGNADARYSLELVSSQSHTASDEVNNLRTTILRVTNERDRLLSSIEPLRRLDVKIEMFEGKYNDLQSKSEFCFQKLNQRISCLEVEIKEFQDAYHKHDECSELRRKLRSTQAELDASRRKLKDCFYERKVMDAKYREASTFLKNQLRTYGKHILDLTKRLAEQE
ncbi:kinesin-like protein KIN-7I [Phalaenopsis equestris]|uniref:kinesin-like protein KIN-7I n=1 Tax=Phalaenopsis equestris TaxID=78828 RepID=UPI0009E5CA5C|nr:kinesin-like protein KIN-7I [Phalaenopsis equestris]